MENQCRGRCCYCDWEGEVMRSKAEERRTCGVKVGLYEVSSVIACGWIGSNMTKNHLLEERSSCTAR
jgi:hypothetical protein